jgi:hypothetical protein
MRNNNSINSLVKEAVSLIDHTSLSGRDLQRLRAFKFGVRVRVPPVEAFLLPDFL